MLFVVPPIQVVLAKSPTIDKYDLSSLEFMLTGAAPTGKDLIEEVYKRLPKLKYIMQGINISMLKTVKFIYGQRGPYFPKIFEGIKEQLRKFCDPSSSRRSKKDAKIALF